MQETQLKKKAMGRQVLARKFPLKVYQEVDGGLVSSHGKSSSVSEEPSCLTRRLLEPEVIRWRQQTRKVAEWHQASRDQPWLVSLRESI